jgi:hypothetical protein
MCGTIRDKGMMSTKKFEHRGTKSQAETDGKTRTHKDRTEAGDKNSDPAHQKRKREHREQDAKYDFSLNQTRFIMTEITVLPHLFNF